MEKLKHMDTTGKAIKWYKYYKKKKKGTANSQTTKGRLSEVCPNNLHSRVIQSSGNTGVNPHDLERDNSLGFVFLFVWFCFIFDTKSEKEENII